MADQRNGGIGWTDQTWNPVRGCSRVTPGCGGPNHEGGCYAEKIAARFSDPGQPYHGFAERTKHGGRWTGKLALVEKVLEQPLRWQRPRRVFVNSMSDLFHESLPDAAIDKVFGVMALCPQHTFQILTKRAVRMRQWFARERKRTAPTECLAELYVDHPQLAVRWPFDVERATGVGLRGWPLPNVWLGVSVEDQARADERIPELLATPAAVRFISAEPLLGPVDLENINLPAPTGQYLRVNCLTGYPCSGGSLNEVGPLPPNFPLVDWVIVGGESGPGARSMLVAWARSLRDQCGYADVPFFFKQYGEWIDADNWLSKLRRDGATIVLADAKPIPDPLDFYHASLLAGLRDNAFEHQSDGSTMIRVGKRAAGRTLDGREHDGFPP